MKRYVFEGKVYEETGEVRCPKEGEWFFNSKCYRPDKANFNFTHDRCPILRPVEEKFKVGDRVKVIDGSMAIVADGLKTYGKLLMRQHWHIVSFGEYPADNTTNRHCKLPDEYNDTCIKGVEDNQIVYIQKRFLQLVNPAIGSTTYRKLKSLSPEKIWANGEYADCKEWETEFAEYLTWQAGHFKNEPILEEVVEWCNGNPQRLPWLIKEGYIEEVKKKEEYMRQYQGVSHIKIMFPNGEVITVPFKTLPDIKVCWEE